MFEFLAIVVVIIAMAGFLGQGRLRATSYFSQSDTAVWYCAGAAVNERADPYLVEPLRSCEIRNDPSHVYPWVEPAPLPGYALAAFAVLARLPFDVARTLWFYLLVGAVLLTSVVLAKLARVPTLLALLCLAVADASVNLFYAELPPLAVAALVGSAALGASKRYAAAAIVAAVSMIEPHIGLPACISMFLWWPKTRGPFIITGVLLGGISIAAIGVPANIEYFAHLLPLQAVAEIAAQDQYSLTRVLHVFGFSDKIALAAGSASYLAMTVLGVAIARRVSTALGSEAMVALLPPAAALLGGPFVHDLQLAAALPAALLFASSARFALPTRGVPIVAIAFPWHHWHIALIPGQAALLDMAAVAGAVLIATQRESVKTRTAAALLGVLGVVALATAIKAVPEHKVGPPTVVAALAVAPNDLSAANWAAFVSRDPGSSRPDARDVSEKVPVWLGLIVLTCMAIALARTKPRADKPTQPPASRPLLETPPLLSHTAEVP